MASRPSFLPSGGDTSTGGWSSLALLLVKSMSLWLDKHKAKNQEREGGLGISAMVVSNIHLKS
jgi:hypothetical protein